MFRRSECAHEQPERIAVHQRPDRLANAVTDGLADDPAPNGQPDGQPNGQPDPDPDRDPDLRSYGVAYRLAHDGPAHGGAHNIVPNRRPDGIPDLVSVAVHNYVGANCPVPRLWLGRLQRERIVHFRVRSAGRILLPSYRPVVVLLLHGRRRLRQLQARVVREQLDDQPAELDL